MKTKNSIFTSIVAITFAIIILAGCKKKEETAPTTPPVTSVDGTQQTQRASDQSTTENQSNQAMDDANSALGQVSTTRGIQTTYCNMTIDSTYKSTGKLILNYNGNDCNNLTSRTGCITVQLLLVNGQFTPWSQAGSMATITFLNYKVTNLATNKSQTFNGYHKVTNVNGGGLIQLYLGVSIVHKIRGAMDVTFDDNTTRTWNTAAKRTLSSVSQSGIVKATTESDTAFGGHNDVAFWGTNRLNENFTIGMPTPFSYMVYGTTCLFRAQTGVIVFYGVAHTLTLTYGVDTNGNVTTACPYGYKFSWTDINGVAQQIVLSY